MEQMNETQPTKYAKMNILHGVLLPETKSSSDLANLDKFLENEKNNNEAEPWCKLNKTTKTKKLLDYVQIYKEENHLTEEETTSLIHFLKDCLDRKKLQRVKDVTYDKGLGVIVGIPSLCYMKQTKHFTLKNIDKRISTLKSLAGPKKNQGTIKKKEIQESDTDDEPEEEDS